eukprot:7973-Heterococcus_DN1.PRE.9
MSAVCADWLAAARAARIQRSLGSRMRMLATRVSSSFSTSAHSSVSESTTVSARLQTACHFCSGTTSIHVRLHCQHRSDTLQGSISSTSTARLCTSQQL